MVVDLFGVKPDPWQVEFLRAFATDQRVAAKACKGPGKTCCLAWVIWNFLLTRPHPKIAVTSITAENLKDNLWTELSKWQQKSALLKDQFVWGQKRIIHRDFHQTWWASARTWPKDADSAQQADTLAGLHADYILFVCDEAGGYPDAVIASAEAALATGKETKLVIVGNPTHNEGPLYRACHQERHLWTVVEITGDPDDPNRSPRISIQWAREQIEKYGADNPWVLVNVFGRFPPSSINSLLGADEVAAAMRRGLNEEDFRYAQKRIGVDVARFGDDRTILFPRQGLMAFRPIEMRNARTDEIAARVMLAKQRWQSEIEMIDDTGGYGGGVVDFMLQSGHSPIPVNFSSKATDNRYLNLRAEMWFRMAEWVKRGGCLPNIPELQRELVAPTYTFMNGKFKLEEKAQVKTRLGFSPDLGDALALTFSLPELPSAMQMPAGLQTVLSERGKMLHEYDPFSRKNLLGDDQ